MKLKIQTILTVSVVGVLFIFGFIKPYFSASSTSYFFGVIEKKPDVKSLLKQMFKEQMEYTESDMLYMPFDKYLLNHEVDPSTVQFNSQYDVDMANEKISYWPYSRVKKVINNMKELGCESNVIRDEPGYKCKLLLDDLSGTGLYEKMIVHHTQRYYFSILVRDGKYIPIELESVPYFSE
jgi:hypothetical protein